MTETRAVDASAPGKLLLLGEYAVLDGAPGLVLAVNRRVQARVVPGAGGRFLAPQLDLDRDDLRVERSAGALCAADGDQPLGVTGRFLPRLMDALGLDPTLLDHTGIRVDSGALFERRESGAPVKLGLGSSAAVCAALTVAIQYAWDVAPDANPLARTLPAYRDALGARASGADLAAAFGGGATLFRSRGEAVETTPATLPAGLYWRAIWTGNAAQTTDFVGAWSRWRAAAGDSLPEPARTLADLAETLRDVDDVDDWLALADRYADGLERLGEAIDMPIVSASHRRLRALGRDSGVVYKSCGAGGGDLGVALADDPGRIEAFAARSWAAGAIPLNLAIEQEGARFEPVRRSVPDQP